VDIITGYLGVILVRHDMVYSGMVLNTLRFKGDMGYSVKELNKLHGLKYIRDRGLSL
jgi:hypothetical protein